MRINLHENNELSNFFNWYFSKIETYSILFCFFFLITTKNSDVIYFYISHLCHMHEEKKGIFKHFICSLRFILTENQNFVCEYLKGCFNNVGCFTMFVLIYKLNK